MSVIDEIAAERQRQISVEGWTLEHDDKYEDNELARAAAAYALNDSHPWVSLDAWPFLRAWFKRTNHRRHLIKAAALIVAEIERLDRQSSAAQGAGEKE